MTAPAERITSPEQAGAGHRSHQWDSGFLDQGQHRLGRWCPHITEKSQQLWAQQQVPAADADPDGATVLEQYPFDEAVRFDGEILARASRIEKRSRRAEPLPVFLGHLIDTKAFLAHAIEVGISRVVQFHPSFDEVFRKWVHSPKIGDAKWPGIAMMLVVDSLIVFERDKKLAHARPVPVSSGGRPPALIVRPIAANVDHCIDRAAATQRLAARPIEPPVVKVRLDFGLTVPVHPSRAGNDADAKRHVNEGIAIARPRLDEADSFIRISRKAVGHDAAGRAAANDVVSVSAEP